LIFSFSIAVFCSWRTTSQTFSTVPRTFLVYAGHGHDRGCNVLRAHVVGVGGRDCNFLHGHGGFLLRELFLIYLLLKHLLLL